MHALTFSPGMLFGRLHESLDSELANMLNAIGNRVLSGRLATPRSTGTWLYGGQERKVILNRDSLISLMLRGTALCFWRMSFVESGLTTDLLEMNLVNQWRRIS